MVIAEVRLTAMVLSTLCGGKLSMGTARPHPAGEDQRVHGGVGLSMALDDCGKGRPVSEVSCHRDTLGAPASVSSAAQRGKVLLAA